MSTAIPHIDRTATAAVVAGAGVCAALVVATGFGLIRPAPLADVLAVLVGCAAALGLWQWRRLGHSTEMLRLHRAVIDQSPNACVTSDSMGRIGFCNPAATRMFGAAGGMQGKWMSDLIEVPDAGSESTAPHRNILDRLGRKMIADGRRADGTTFPIEVSVLRVGSGRQTMFAAYVRDLTDERKVDAAHRAQQDRIHQNEKLTAMSSLLAGVAHELNNPLAILVTQATLLREKAPSPDIERRAERIYAAAQRAGRIVKTFLAMARQKTPVRAATEINGVVEAAAELVGYGLRSAGIQLQYELDPHLPPVEADRDLMGQVFAAVLINAQQALAELDGERRIVVRSFRTGADVVVQVADNGCGVPADVSKKIFEPYFTTKPVGAGTGIGLSLCRGIMADHGGRIDLLPATAPGATFEVALPVLAVTDHARPATRTRGALTILVIDDEPDVADSLAELLDVFGHRAVVLSSPAEAIERLKRDRFDAVITDLRMPGMNGVALHRAIRALDPRLAANTVIMTGDTVTGRAGDGSDAEAPAGLVLEKPFTADSVRAVLDQVQS